MRPIDIVRKVCPGARASYLAAFENGDALFEKHGITTPLRLAHFLAQCLHETGGLKIERESGAYSANRIMEIFGVGVHSAKVTSEEAQKLAGDGPALFERVYGLGNPRKAKELGNNQPGDGWKYRGGGIMQTTGRGNYRRMGERCGVDFETHPEWVVSSAHALKPALAEWTEGNLNAKADPHEGFPNGDIRSITKRINGGFNGLADRQWWFNKVRPLIDRVDLKQANAPAPVPVPKAEAGGAGAVIIAGGGAAANQASKGASATEIALIIGATLIAAVLMFAAIRWIKSKRG